MTRWNSVVCWIVTFAILASLQELISAQSNALVVAKPRPSAGPVNNPLKGWCPYTDAGPIKQPYSMVFQYISWRELEPNRGDFRFDEWERKWDEGAGKGKHIVLRMYIDYPTKPSGLPDWIRKAGVKETQYSDYGGGMSPDYHDPIMVAAMERLIEALGKRYNRNPRIAFIQLGLLGFWGEWHTYPRTELYASANTEAKIVDAYHRAFPDKMLMVRNANGYSGRQSWLGFHDDMFPEDTDNGMEWSFLAGLRKAGRANNWQRAVVGGEMVPGKAEQWLTGDFAKTQAMLDASHFTWVGPYCPALDDSSEPKFLRQSEALVQRMGYNFQMTEIKHPSRINKSAKISLSGNNTGVAPFYYPWPVELALLNAADQAVSVHKTKWDIRKWQPGIFHEHCEANFDAPTGKYRLAIGIRDPWSERLAVQFANEVSVVAGWSVLSELEAE